MTAHSTRPWLGVLATAALASATSAADLSPGSWPVEERARLEREEMQIYPASSRIVEGSEAIVATTGSPLAAHAGIEALRQGGTAADAAVAVAMTQIATLAGSVISYAGIAEILYYEAASGKVYALDAGWNSYREETDAATIPSGDVSRFGGEAAQPSAGQEGRKTLVPGFMAGMNALHERFGMLKFGELLAPAIWYADKGVTITPLLAAYFPQRESNFLTTPEGRTFVHPGGALPRTGELYRQPELAETLRGVAREGAGYMYGGAWGQAYVDIIRREGGKVTLADMLAYRPDWREPLSTSFAGTTVVGPNELNSSSCRVLTGLALSEAMKLPERPPYWEDPAAFRDFVDLTRFSLIGSFLPPTLKLEQDSGLASTCRTRITAEYAAKMAPHVRQLAGIVIGGAAAGSHSAAIVVVDRHGNVASLVHTINTGVWGETGIVVGGVPVSDAGGMQKALLAQLAPGSRIPTTMAPLIVLKDGQPVLAVATVGTSLVPETIRTVVGWAAGLAPDKVRAAPPLLNFTSPLGPRFETVPTGAYPASLLATVRSEGLDVREDRTSIGGLRGTAAIGLIDAHGRRQSAEVPGALGVAEGY